MAKIVVYECDICNKQYKNSNQVFNLIGVFKNGDNEVLFESSQSAIMICNNCLFHNNKIEDDIVEESEDIISQFNDIRELIDTPHHSEIECVPKDLSFPIQQSNNLSSFLDTMKESIKEDHLIISDDKFQLKEDDTSIQEVDKSEYIEEREEIPNNDPSDSSPNNNFFNITKLQEEDYLSVVNHFGFDNIEEFYTKNNIKTLDNVFIALNDVINKPISEIMKTHAMSIESILINNNGKISVKKASVFLNDVEDSGYISEDILNQIYSV